MLIQCLNNKIADKMLKQLRIRMKYAFFYFALLRWCHNGWASNILIVVDTGYGGIHQSKYLLPFEYWQKKKIKRKRKKKKKTIFHAFRSLEIVKIVSLPRAPFYILVLEKRPCRGLRNYKKNPDHQFTSHRFPK